MKTTGVPWHHSGLPSKLFWLDGWVAVPFLLWCIHIRQWTFAVFLMSVVLSLALYFLEMTLSEFGQYLRRKVVGSHISHRHWWLD